MKRKTGGDIMVKKEKITHKNIFALVNSIQIVPFTTKNTQISFQYIVDSRHNGNMQTEIREMIQRFKRKADKMGLKYKIGNIRKVTFGGSEPSTQLRVDISITKPRFNK
ncbi:MAG: hypothetical protein U9R47_07740 [Actinomycetota bacterium]|nr:hypothetical protein [Actinomycetota bacterium]